jgi:hypothetical protein
MTCYGLQKDVERTWSTCQQCQMIKKERKKYGLIPSEIAAFDPR